ncbi:MAG: hypothetical protein BVN34_09095 [Proteobacteria bacterium ST_bin12]|nr:MAG: hypothetical protein BVN34_09095 [Proteobacteria bacterium ST_bin12]
MKNLVKPNPEEAILSHELEFINESPADVFNEYLATNGEQSEMLTKQFDSAVTRLSNRFSSSNMAEVSELMHKKRSILQELLLTATSLGLTVDVSEDDIPNLVEEELDAYIILFSSSSDDDSDLELDS